MRLKTPWDWIGFFILIGMGFLVAYMVLAWIVIVLASLV